MGIRNLNRFLRKKCTTLSIKKKHLSDYRNKTIVIDTSIYLYRFNTDNALIENMYTMISIFRQYNITPLFVFDGKPPLEKYETIKQRREERYYAQLKYNELLLEMNENSDFAIKQQLENLKRKIVKINESHVNKVKMLMDSYGVSYYSAVGEADIFCCYMVLSGRADACLSDDTDMFMYNCPYVLRNLSILNHTIIEHNTEKIFNEIGINYNMFKMLMVLVCNDYNKKQSFEIEELFRLFQEYKKQPISLDFYNWLNTKGLSIDTFDVNKITDIYNINYEQQNTYADEVIIENKNPNNDELYNMLKSEGFLCYRNDLYKNNANSLIVI